jgi:hypothetical protein
MFPPVGRSPAERWVAEGIRAAALDLIEGLRKTEMDISLHALTPEEGDLALLRSMPVETMISSPKGFHFGKALLAFAREHGKNCIAYFGAGSAPLLDSQLIIDAAEKVLQAKAPKAVVNNFHSTDWAIFHFDRALEPLCARLPTDNQIGWVLANEAGYQVEALPANAATRCDIDTPTDLLMISKHPQIGKHLQDFVGEKAIDGMGKIEAVRKILATPASTLGLIGRASSHLWLELERRTQIWVRVFAEERGMLASGRLARGEVRSLIAEVVRQWGAEAFVEYLSQISDAVLWDTRVWMGHERIWPTDADRFASDLGWVDAIENPSLRELTRAIASARIPIISGGHGVVAGGVYALLESLNAK